MIPPGGFKQPDWPLRHKFYNAFGLSPVDEDSNTTYIPIIRHYKTTNVLDTIDVNPKHASYDKETGCVCSKNSIIDKLKINLTFNRANLADNTASALRIWWQPIFFSFGEKLDAADDFTGTTVASLLGLVKDATEEDVTPLYNNTKLITLGASDRAQPVTTVNMTETFGILNMDTNLNHESVTYDDELIKDALTHYTNKGALRACMGRRRYLTLDKNHTHQSFFIDKPVPRAVRRIVKYSFMAILVHFPIVSKNAQLYQNGALTTDLVYCGITCKVKYNEWNEGHMQDLTG